jgi:hypothetical protein
MRAAALASGVKPEVEAAKYAREIAEAIETCPDHIAALANASHMKVVVVGQQKNINHIVPNDMGLMMLQTLAGGATGQGIYVKSEVLKSPTVLKEEFIHELERNAVRRNGIAEIFSLQPEWIKAISRDVENGKNNAAYKYLLEKSDSHFVRAAGSNKANAALTSSVAVLSAENPIQFVEAVPDAYHMAAAADEIIAKEGKIKIGGVTYRTREEVMHAALPNAWSMLEGPAKDMRLVQHIDGTVRQIGKDATVMEGAEPALSLREHSEVRIAEKYAGPIEDLIPKRTSRIPNAEAGRMAAESENSALRFLRNEKWIGKKGLAVVGAAVAIGVAIYGGHKLLAKKKPSHENEAWVNRVSSPASAQRSL